MGIFNKIKKAFKSEDEEQVNQSKRRNVGGNNKNFSYLDDLINSGHKEINLEYDIILEDGEEEIYPEGINIISDGIVINGNGHVIDARKKIRIFKIVGNNVLLTKIKFINAFANVEPIKDSYTDYLIKTFNLNDTSVLNDTRTFDALDGQAKRICEKQKMGSVIYNSAGSVILENCILMNNSSSNGGIINSSGNYIELNNVVIENNESNNLIVLSEKSSLNIAGGKIVNNISKEPLILNQGKTVTIKNTLFENNNASSLIENDGELNIKDPLFKDNDGDIIINKGKTIFSPSNLEDIIDNRGTIKSNVFKEGKWDFSKLNELIRTGIEPLHLVEDGDSWVVSFY